MTSELYWLTLSCLLVGLMWVPYILNRIAVRGLIRAMGNDAPETIEHSPWAKRAMSAHRNAVENIGIFAAVVLTAQAVGVSTGATAMAAAVFFFARLAHYIVYIAGIPVVRTLLFAASWLCIMIIGFAILGA